MTARKAAKRRKRRRPAAALPIARANPGGFHPQWKKYKNRPAVRAASQHWAEVYREWLTLGASPRRVAALKDAEAAIAAAVESEIAPRRNRPLAAVRHGSRAGHVLSRHVLSISYYHAESAGRRPYVHQFEREDIEMLGLPDGSLVIRHPHYRLWEDRVVPENA